MQKIESGEICKERRPMGVDTSGESLAYNVVKEVTVFM